MWAGARFRVPLETERGFAAKLEPLQASVEQGLMRHARIFGQAVKINSKSVILAGNHHFTGIDVLNGVIGTVVPEFHLYGTGARC